MNTAQNNPFKGLEPLGPGDMLFGRDGDLTLVTDRIFRSKTTLLFAGSGVGKTSFFRAKFIPDINARYGEEVQVRYYNEWAREDPLAGLKDALGAEPGESLQKFFERTAQTQASSWILVLDQFEELFTHHVYRPHFGAFRDELCDAINRTDPSVRFTLSMREEFLGELSVFDSRIPDVFGNYYRLKNPDRQQAEQIIRLTANTANAVVNDAGLTALIEDLSKVEAGTGRSRDAGEIQRDYVVPPHLQLVCRGLWELQSVNESENGGFEFLRGYTAQERAGRQNPARQILQKFCTDQMDALTRDQQVLAAQAFDFLVTSQGAKMSYELKSLARHMNTEENVLATILERLSNPKTRILRESQWQDERWFELYHDMYAPIMYEWKQRLDEQQKKEREREQSAGMCDRRAIQAEARGNPDKALLFWLLAMGQRDTDDRRRQAGRLTRDVTALERTFRHEGPVTAVCFGNELRTIVTASSFRRVPAAVGDMRQRSKSDELDAAEELSLIQLWDVLSGAPVGQPFEVSGAVRAIAMSPDESLIAAVGDDYLFRIDVIRAGRPISWKIPGRSSFRSRSRPTRVRFDDKGERVLVECQGRLWYWLTLDIKHKNAKNRKLKLLPDMRKYTRLAFSPDGTRVAAVAGRRVAIIDAWTGKPGQHSLVGNDASAMVFSPNGKQLLIGSRNGLVQLWDFDAGKTLSEWLCRGGAIRRVAFGAKGTVWVQSEEHTGRGKRLRLQEWNFSGKAMGEPWEITGTGVGPSFWPRFSPAAHYLWESIRTQVVWRIESRAVLGSVWGRDARIKTHWSRDDRYLLTASRVGLARLWKAAALPPAVPMFAESAGSVSSVLSRDGSLVAAAARTGTISVWQTRGQLICELPATREVQSIAFGPDGKILASLHSDGTVRVWDIDGASIVAEIRVRNAGGLVFSSDGEVILIVGYPNTKWWTFSDPKTRSKSLPGGDACSRHDGRVFATYDSFEGRLFVWKSSNAKKLAAFSHSESLNSVALSADGKLLLSAGDDGRAKVWNIKEGTLRHELSHQGPVTAAAFSGNGRYVATLSDDLIARLWETDEGNEIGRFRYERSAGSVRFSPDDTALIVAAQRAVHLCKIDGGGGLLPVATRQLSGSWTGECSFLDPSGNQVILLTQSAFQNWRVETIRFDVVEGEPLQGEVTALQEDWCIRTGLRYEGEDVVPVSMVRATRSPRQRRTSKGNAESIGRA